MTRHCGYSLRAGPGARAIAAGWCLRGELEAIARVLRALDTHNDKEADVHFTGTIRVWDGEECIGTIRALDEMDSSSFRFCPEETSGND